MSIAARNAAASNAQSVTTSGVRDRKHSEDYKACVRRTGTAWVEIITLCICSVNFMFHRRPTERHSPMFSTAERPVCVPYKRKGKGTTPYRLHRKKFAATAVCKKEINLTA